VVFPQTKLLYNFYLIKHLQKFHAARIKDAGADDKPGFFAWPLVFRNFFKK
jgi:hypothetical protein